MQQIERYGVIVLVFLLVTIVAVSFWGDGKSPGFWSRLTGKSKKEEVAKVEPPAATPPATSEQALAGGAPLNPSAPVDPLATQPPGLGAASQTPPVGGGTNPLLATGAPPTPVTPASFGAQGNGLGVPPTNVGAAPITPLPIPPAPSPREYTVQKGDSLALIARRTLGSEQRWSEIQTLNPGVTPKSLKIGMKLQLPEGATTAAVQPKPAASEPKAASVAAKSASKSASVAKKTEAKSGAHYTIQRGDTLNAIAERKLGSKARVKDILALNPGLDPKKLVVGKSLLLPSGTATEKPPLVAAAVTTSRDSGRARVR
ncbi:MAG: LysM peptidoglycan-binding domain-containing protein [Planctomycetes bacterium]|nr:LysM peptidoglycan-binding domain-containing protein [Planctomycetota bacterium]